MPRAAWKAAILLLGAWMGFFADVAFLRATESNGDGTTAPQATAYSKGNRGSRLKWSSQRPQSAATDSKVVPTQHVEPAKDPAGKDWAPTEPKPSSEPARLLPTEPPTQQPPYYAPEKASTQNRRKKGDGNLERALVPRQMEFKEGCPSPKDLKPISELNTNITPTEGELPRDCPLGDTAFQPRKFAPITYAWTASGLCHKPLYFEDVQLERYGHMAGPWVQPLASGAHFFMTIPILPYKMGLEPPNECIYTLGYYRPGNCAPYLFDPIPISLRGALFEGGAWVGGCFAFP